MKAVLFRTGSVPSLPSLLPATGSPIVSLSRHNSFSGVFSGDKSDPFSGKISIHLDVKRRGISRALSEPDLVRSESDFSRAIGSFPAVIPEEEECIGSIMMTECAFDFAGDWMEMRGSAVEEFGFSGGGSDQGRSSGGGGGGRNNGDSGTGNFAGGNADRSKIGAYYKEMLKLDPTNSLLLRNYAKFLHEVERDIVKAEEYYGRAILASPGDGEVLSLYGKLIWEKDRDEVRAKSYFDQAVSASPNDCMVLGSYAQFMWEAEEDDDDKEEVETEREVQAAVMATAAIVEAF